jgi:hypothetical protein
MAVTLPGTGLAEQDDIKGAFKTSPEGTKRKLLFLTDSPQKYEPLTNKIRAIKEYEFTVSPAQVNLQKAPETVGSLLSNSTDILFTILPQGTTSSANIAVSIGDWDIPVMLFPANLDLIM